MTIKELSKLEIDKLHEKLAELRERTRTLRFDVANNQLKKVREFRNVKKDIARILTLVNLRRLEGYKKQLSEIKNQSDDKSQAKK